MSTHSENGSEAGEIDVAASLLQLLKAVERLELRINKIDQGSNSKQEGDVESVMGLLSENSTPHVRTREVNFDRSYITAWKELGGNQLSFSAGGSIHPVQFIRKVEAILDDAGVPENKRITLAVNCLKGSANDWAQMRNFNDFLAFKNDFLKRYWGVDEERELYDKIRYGKFTDGSMADYFMRTLKEMSYLNHPMENEKAVEYIVNHFPVDIRCGLLNAGCMTIEDVEKHLRRIDKCRVDQNRNRSALSATRNNAGAVPRNFPRNADQWRSSNATNNTNEPNGEQSGRLQQNHEVSMLFANNPEELLVEEIECQKNKMIALPTIQLEVQGKSMQVLLDTGCQLSSVSAKLFNELNSDRSPLPVFPVNGVVLRGAIKEKPHVVKCQVLLEVKIGDFRLDVPFIVVKGLNREIIMGYDWLKQYNARIDCYKEVVQLTIEEKQIVELPITREVVEQGKLEVGFLETGLQIISAESELIGESEIKEAVKKSEMLNENEKENLYKLLCENKHVFSNKPGRVNNYEHEILLKDYTPFFLKSYAIPVKYREVVQKQIEEMIGWDVIEPAQTEYISPLVIVIKKDKSVRVCLDARYLNSRMVRDHVIPPNPEELVFPFSERAVLSTVDLTSSYWQIPIKKEHRQYTGFMYDNQSFIFKVLPFGLSTSIASFIKALKKILGGFEFVIPYVDDVLIFSKNGEEHLQHLEAIFKKLSEAGITLKLKKAKFAKEKITFIGHIVSATNISLDPSRVRSITEFPTPRNVKHLKAFLGLCNYERRFVERFAELTVPLLKLLKKGTYWRWGVEEHQAFENVKRAYLQVVFLHHPQTEKPFYIQSDSSNYAIGGCLFQLDNNNERAIISFCSRTLRGPEVNYGITEKEALAIVYCLQQFRVFVLGADLTVVTDHKALTFLKTCRLLNSRLTRWTLYIQEYDFQIKYCPGRENITSDVLSRYPVEDEQLKDSITEELDIFQVNLLTAAVKETYKLVKNDMNNLKEAQNNDDGVRRILKKIEDGDTQWFGVHQGLVIRKDTSGYKVVIPESHVKNLIRFEHESNGHFGPYKCYQALRRWYYWPKMKSQVFRAVAQCELCQQAKVSRRMKGSMHSAIPEGPNDLLCLDLVGPLPKSRGGVQHLLVTVDAFSKYVRLYPLKRATTVIILNRLVKEQFPEVGKPKRILSDNGTQFTSRRWKNTLEEWGIKVIFTSTYFPQGNCTERVNREIGRLLRSMCHAQHTKWAFAVSEVEKLLNQVIHDSTSFTPEEVHFHKTRDNPFISADFFQTSQGLPQRDHLLMLVKEKLVSKAARRKAQHEKRGRCEELEEGDWVYVRQHPQSSAEDKTIKKLFLLYEGPYRVVEVKGCNVYRLVDKEGNERGTHNIINLKRKL